MQKKRFKIFFGIILFSFFIIFCRLFYVQIIEGWKYSGISDNKKIRTIGTDALRGAIYDRNGSTLAVDRHSFELKVLYKKLFSAYSCFKDNILPELPEVKNSFAEKQPEAQNEIARESCKKCHNPDSRLWVREVAELLEIPYLKVFEKTGETVEKVKKIKQEVEGRNKRKIHIKEETIPHSLISDIEWRKIAKFEASMSDLPGIWVSAKPVRWYACGDLASHIIGYVGKLSKKEIYNFSSKKKWFDSLEKRDKSESEYFVLKASSLDTLVGKSGIEKIYNSRLMGISGERFEETTLDALETKKLILERPPMPGNNIFLTIDSRIQSIVEEILGNRKGSIIVMNPWNGEIIAMAASPRYNLNTWRKDFSTLSENPDKPFLHRPIQSVLPPGSVFKIITAIAALEENRLSENTHFTCNGELKAGSVRFRCFSKYGHGLMNIEEAIQYSCNIYFFEAAKKLGGSLIREWANKFGLGVMTDIDLPFEKKGKIPVSMSIYETLNMSIGQGKMLVTPIQITEMIAMIVNGGWRVKPHILKKATDYKGDLLPSYKLRPTERINVSEKNLDIIKRSLRKVVEAGTAKNTGLDKFHVAGKTGTAETSREHENHAWFVGYAPFEDPKYCFTIVIEHTPGHGADVAGTIVKKLLTELNVMEIL